MTAPAPLFTVRQLIAAWGDGRAMNALLSPDLCVDGVPPFAVLLDTAIEADDRRAALAARGWSVLERDLTEGAGGRVFAEGAWTHDNPGPGGGGSAGAFHIVFTVQDGLVNQIRFFEDHQAARQYAGLL